jgi:hypothetical protein
LNTSVVTLPASGNTDKAAFLGEASLAGSYALTCNLSVRGGYQLLWASGVALASDQVPVTDFIFGTGIDASGDVFYHGAFIGLEFAQ